MLSDSEVRALEQWVRSAQSWSENAQALVGTAGELTLASRELADRFGERHGGLQLAADDVEADTEADGVDGGALKSELLRLAKRVEDDTQELRDRYLATAACIDQYHELLG